MKEHEKKKFAKEVQERDDVKAVKSVMAKWNEICAACVKANTHVKAMQANNIRITSFNKFDVCND